MYSRPSYSGVTLGIGGVRYFRTLRAAMRGAEEELGEGERDGYVKESGSGKVGKRRGTRG